MQVLFELSIGFAKCTKTATMEVEDDTTDEQIDEMLRDWVNDTVDAGWSKLP